MPKPKEMEETISLKEAAERLLFSSTFVGVKPGELRDYAETTLYRTNWRGKADQVISAMGNEEVIKGTASDLSEVASLLVKLKYGSEVVFPVEQVEEALRERT